MSLSCCHLKRVSVRKWIKNKKLLADPLFCKKRYVIIDIFYHSRNINGHDSRYKIMLLDETLQFYSISICDFVSRGKSFGDNWQQASQRKYYFMSLLCTFYQNVIDLISEDTTRSVTNPRFLRKFYF